MVMVRKWSTRSAVETAAKKEFWRVEARKSGDKNWLYHFKTLLGGSQR